MKTSRLPISRRAPPLIPARSQRLDRWRGWSQHELQTRMPSVMRPAARTILPSVLRSRFCQRRCAAA